MTEYYPVKYQGEKRRISKDGNQMQEHALD